MTMTSIASCRYALGAKGRLDVPSQSIDWKGILGGVTPILVTTQFGQ